MHPILFHIGSYTVHTFGVILMIAFAVSVTWAYKSAERLYSQTPTSSDSTPPKTESQSSGLPEPADILDVSVWLILAGVIGARAMFVALDWSDYKSQPGSWFAIWEGGISFHGALIGGLIALVTFTVRRRLSFLKLVDVLVPSVMLGYAIGRIGCFFNGCCYGAPTNMPWGVRFFDDGHWTVPSHPTQIYASIMAFTFFGVLAWMGRRKAYDGQILGWYLIFTAIERFVMEIWRGGYTSTVRAFGLTDVQYLCMAILAIGIGTLIFLRRRRASTAPATPPVGAVTH